MGVNAVQTFEPEGVGGDGGGDGGGGVLTWIDLRRSMGIMVTD